MDVIDKAQQRQLDDIEQALQSRKPAEPGRETCANATCGEPITPVRQALGAQFCLDCQRDIEMRQRGTSCRRGV